jgi:dephospho-CoA kinase
MYLVGLTGGIGAGKSTVAGLLADRGAAVVDADQLAREAVAPGTSGLAEIAALFGDEVLLADGSLDRKALAAKVFHDAGALAALNAIVHPRVAALFDERLRGLPPDAVVVHDIPLLVETGAQGRYDLVVVVEAPDEVRLERLAARGLPHDEALSRIRAQAAAETRAAVADVVIRNEESPEQLAEQVAALWQRIVSEGTPAGPAPAG